MNNIKLYGININGFTVIPCYCSELDSIKNLLQSYVEN
jgi:hypothetical protein